MRHASATLRRLPTPMWVAALFLAALAVAAALVAGNNRAEAQTATTRVGVLSNFRVLADANGYSNLPEFSGQGDGVIGMQCSGAAPLGGPRAPGQVITNLRFDLTHLRVLTAQGSPLSGEVVINCTAMTTNNQTAARLDAFAAAHRARF
jgi:hypothetical protein